MKMSFRAAGGLVGLGGLLTLALAFMAAAASTPAAPGRLPAQTGTAAAYFPFVAIPVSPSPTATPTPTATPPPVTPPASGDWQAFLGYYRASARLPALAINPDWSAGAAEHACYVVQNDLITNVQDPSKPCASPAGATAAANSMLYYDGNPATTDKQALDNWMSGPFHSVAIIDPALKTTGYGRDTDAAGTWRMAAVLDIYRGLDPGPPGVPFPVRWPDHNTTVYLTSYSGTEQPDPLTSCPGFGLGEEVGLPIVLQIGPGSVINDASPRPVVTSHSFRRGNTQLAHCVFDETNYFNALTNQQTLGRSILAPRDAIVLIPRNPLTAGTYSVSITAYGSAYTWSFHVAP